MSGAPTVAPNAAARVTLIGMAAVLALAAVGGGGGVGTAVIGIVVGLSLLLTIELTDGSSVAAGHAVVIALAYSLAPGQLAAVVAIGTAMSAAASWPAGWRAVTRGVIVTGAAAAAAGLVVAGLDRILPVGSGQPDSVRALIDVVTAGTAYLVVAWAGASSIGAVGRGLARPTMTSGVYLALLSCGALMALAGKQGGFASASIAGLPLLVTRFSLQRYSTARRTYDQTIQALGIVPELAGHVPLGHSERTAAYADAMCDQLQVAPELRARLGTAARLHHIGNIALPEPELGGAPPATTVVSMAGGEILRETGFLTSVADLVAAVGREGPATDDDLSAWAAVVHVASLFDQLVGDDPARAEGAFALLASRVQDDPGRAALAALRQECLARPDLVETAIGWGAPLVAAAAGAPAPE
jgi:hypothetical protein